ncbi:FAD-dependent oxidoreductase [Acrocarpospora sp. B8E8]|uniref:flavin-containing monooxygenase n=1 Tax=Acrocarpospora sp. B8E8 TaxID=3153572 RepID=UPI00325F78D0
MNTVIDTIVIGGGQSGLAALHSLRERGRTAVLLEAGEQLAGSWPHYYDSLTLFSPARYSCLPGLAFGGDPEHYPHRDEVVAYLTRYARELTRDGAQIRTGARVVGVVAAAGGGFTVRLADGQRMSARSVIAATGSFARPWLPPLTGADTFTGQIRHAAGYRSPEPYAGRRVVVVGAGNSAVQIAVELAAHARVTLASRAPVRFVPQRPLGRDLHFWFRLTGFDRLPLRRTGDPVPAPVLDPGRYRRALAAGLPDRRPMFTRLTADQVEWADGTRERVDVVLLATGYRPNLDYLAGLGALDADGRPRHDRGLSTSHPGLGYLGLEWQRTPSSNTLRGVGADARHLVGRLTARLGTGRVPART